VVICVDNTTGVASDYKMKKSFKIIGVFFVVLMVIGFFASRSIENDFKINKIKILSDMESAYKNGDFEQVVAIGKRYEFVNDYEFRKMYDAADRKLANKSASKSNENQSSKQTLREDEKSKNLELPAKVDQQIDIPKTDGFFANIFKMSAKIDGDTATAHELVSLNADLEMIGDKIAKTVFNVAKDYAAVKKVRVIIELNGSTVFGTITDNYGKRISGPYIMGEILDDDLTETRKYASATAYADRMKGFYAAKIKNLKYGNLWKK
jgi:hypothetical protein